jgi:hypothetical protein
MMNRSVVLFLRVLVPLVGLPVGLTGVATAAGAALAAAVRVVDRVHGDAADVRAEAHVARRPALPRFWFW